MAKQALVTKRTLKNDHTGIDLLVPEYVDQRGRLGTGSVCFKVIVATNLPYFKTDKHKESDVVQFTLERRFTDFEKFQTDLLKEFPGFHLPALPPKIPNIMLTVGALEDRLAAFDSLVKKVAQSTKVCTGNSLLDFLGVSSHKRIEVFRKKRLAKKDQEKVKAEVIAAEEDSDDDLFAVKGTKKLGPEKSESKRLFSDEEEEDLHIDGQELDFDQRVELEIDDPLKAGKLEQTKANETDPLTSDMVSGKDEELVDDTPWTTRSKQELRETKIILGVGEEEEEDELFKNLPKPRAGYKGGSLFDESSKSSLFDEDSKPALDFFVSVEKADEKTQNPKLFEPEDDEDLFREDTTDNFEAKIAPKPKPTIKPKPKKSPIPKPIIPSNKTNKPPVKTKPATKPVIASKPTVQAKKQVTDDDLFSMPTDVVGEASSMGDVSRYIEMNLKQQASEKLDLFS